MSFALKYDYVPRSESSKMVPGLASPDGIKVIHFYLWLELLRKLNF